jgi:hypothetical protein
MSLKNKPLIVAPSLAGTSVHLPDVTPALPKIKSILPFGSKILVEVLRDDEIIGSNIIVSNGKGSGTGGDGAPQGVIIKLGPNVDPTCGLKEGQRVYWSGKGTAVSDPQVGKGRTRALLEISNILAIIEEDK